MASLDAKLVYHWFYHIGGPGLSVDVPDEPLIGIPLATLAARKDGQESAFEVAQGC